MTESVYIAAGARTPMGGMQGCFSDLSAVDLGSAAIAAAIERANLNSEDIQEIIMGCVLPNGLRQGPARQAAMDAGIPVESGATTINKLCGSGMKATMLAHDLIKAGSNEIMVAGGMESMTNAPKFEKRNGEEKEMVSTMVHDGLWDVYNDVHMGNTGEIVANECNISREKMDAFAARSQNKAAQAEANGWFAWERFDMPELSIDEGVRAGTTAEKLAGLKPVFQEDGMVTAGNASTLNDGASAILVADEDFAKENGWEIIAIIEDYCTAGVEPHRVMYAPVPAIKMLLERANMDVMDIDIYEHNEAFASASCAVAQDVGIPDDRFNLHGGAVALGHPLGSSGTRCLITMIGVMRRLEAKSGIVSLCLGGGNAVAMRISRN